MPFGNVANAYPSVLSSGFAESTQSDMDAPYPSDRPTTSNLYGYGDDSDLEYEIQPEPSVKEEIAGESSGGGTLCLAQPATSDGTGQPGSGTNSTDDKPLVCLSP